MQRRRANNPLRRIMPFSSVFSYSLFLLTLFCSVSSSSSKLSSDDAPALLAFKSTADPQNKLQFSLNKTFDHCKFQGVKCVQGRVVRLVLEGLGLDGSFGNATLTRLNQLRVLSLQNNSLTGPIPDLSGLPNLKTLFLDHNKFSGTFPLSVLSLHRLRTLDLSYNHFTGEIPSGLVKLDRVYYLRLEWNRLSGPVPAFNQSTLQVFNVSGNNLTGAVPVTVALSRFDLSSFSGNPGLCGEIVRKECRSSTLLFFFDYSPVPQPPAAGENEEVRGLVLPAKSRKMAPLILGFSIAGVVIIGCLMVGLLVMKKRRRNQTRVSNPPTLASDLASAAAAAVMWVEEENELEAKVKQMQGIQIAKSGSLVFCAGEAQVYSLDQLMRASAELLGRGSIGTTYKAVLDNQLIVTVKRLDAVKTAITSRDMFERHLESVGSLRHPNLVPLRAYFQAKEERLIIYDYQPNGSLFSLVHGSRSGRAKPLHWTSCLKIAEDVAQGLAYIHQASRLVHGNLKSSNILLGADFEACLTDYCLAVLANSSQDDSDSSAYWAPEMRKSTSQATAKSDVYSFGVLLLELLTGKPPAQHPFLMPEELLSWVRSVREVEAGEENRVAMLLELATTCSLTSSEQRPTMWRVLKMIQEIKDAVMMEDNELISTIGYS